ncbi:MAG: acyltransferase family protein, partial [Lachnospiraceae bacterium]|nr:acyltransferase family protein [Lachnospiraceae bacterium]
MGKRLNYIDNLRSITVFLLVLYHIALAYNSWGEANYIFFERVNPIASIVVFISPWFMPLMFLLAGVSASFSMKKRGVTAFIKERLKRLG